MEQRKFETKNIASLIHILRFLNNIRSIQGSYFLIDYSEMSLSIKMEYRLRDVVRLVGPYIHCLVYDWTVKDE